MRITPVLAACLLAMPLMAVANDDEGEAETLVIHGARTIASGYEARGTNVQRVDVDETDVVPSAMADLLTHLPGVAENGQGGWVQMYALRGVSRQRVVTFLAGMPIITDRRAGTAAHFVDPALLGEASVMAASLTGSGPSSWSSNTSFGSQFRRLPRRMTTRSPSVAASCAPDPQLV